MATEKSRARPPEQKAVRTTSVGARPPGSGKGLGKIPRGIEVLVKKASVDPDFRALLIECRAQAAKEIDLELTPAEDAMLSSVPAPQLEAIIARTKVSRRNKTALLGGVAVVMLAALGGGTTGIRPDRPEKVESEEAGSEEEVQANDETTPPPNEPGTRGARPERPEDVEQGQEFEGDVPES
jgi:hypothetical protein